ncbi:MAG: hypothetical protein K2J14_03840 [Treponemataceae bacterium]|nr:hypothetical protein [Treponemataceae bacterium]
MAWTSKFAGVDYKKRAEYLHNYLTQRPDGLAQRSPVDPFARGYKDVLSFIVASLCVRSEYRYISEGAKDHLKKHGIAVPVYEHMYHKGKHPECEGLTHEHTIPTSVIVEHLASLDKELLTVEYLTDFIEKVSGLALITDEEDDALNDNGLRNKLPSGTTLDAILQGKKPHSARYDAAGIKMADTNHGAKA